MNEDNVTEYFKRTQRDYSYSFKLNVVRQVERGYLGVNAAQRNYGIQGNGTISTWLRKYGSLDWDNKSRSTLPKFPEQKLLELEQKFVCWKSKRKEIGNKQLLMWSEWLKRFVSGCLVWEQENYIICLEINENLWE